MKKLSLSKEKQKAWKAFSLWVRLSAADYHGFVRCITCGCVKHYKEMQSGHFIPGRLNAVLFSEEGVHPQCYQCNVGKNGNWPSYYEWMKGMYGLEVIDQLIYEARQPKKYTVEDYQNIYIDYSERIKSL